MAWVLVLLSACTSGESPSTASEPSASESASTSAAPSGRQFPEPSSAPLPAETIVALQTVLDDWVAAGSAAGVMAAVVTDHGSWSGAAGADSVGTTLTPETSSALASVTKPFVAAEVMRLVEEGEVDLDNPMSDYVTHPLLANGATVRDALGMRSGIVDPNESELDPMVQDLYRHWTMEETLALITTPLAEPDTKFAYSNANYLLLGLLIEKLRGTSLAEALHAGLFDANGLARIAVQDSDLPSAPAAAPGPDTLNLPPTEYMPARAIASGGAASYGLAADAPTTARAVYLLYGGHLVSPDSVREMTPVFAADEYGLGTARFVVGGASGVGHRGMTNGYQSFAAFVPDRSMSVAVLVPYAVDPKPVADALARALESAEST